MIAPVPITRAELRIGRIARLGQRMQERPSGACLRAIALVLGGWPRSRVARAPGTTAQSVRYSMALTFEKIFLALPGILIRL